MQDLCDHCGKPRGLHSGAVLSCTMYPTFRSNLNTEIEHLQSQLNAAIGSLERLVARMEEEGERLTVGLADALSDANWDLDALKTAEQKNV